MRNRKSVLRIEPAPEQRCDCCPTLSAWRVYWTDSPDSPETLCWTCFNTLMSQLSDQDDPDIRAFYERWMTSQSKKSSE